MTSFPESCYTENMMTDEKSKFTLRAISSWKMYVPSGGMCNVFSYINGDT